MERIAPVSIHSKASANVTPVHKQTGETKAHGAVQWECFAKG